MSTDSRVNKYEHMSNGTLFFLKEYKEWVPSFGTMKTYDKFRDYYWEEPQVIEAEAKAEVDITKVIPTSEEVDFMEYKDGDKKRNWCFTLNNYTQEEVDALNLYKCDYIVYGHEVGESGTPHLQGYFEFNSGKAFKTLKRAFPRMCLGVRKGTSEQASMYCKKGEQSHEEWCLFKNTKGGGWFGPNFGLNFKGFECGTRSKQGDRSDLAVCAEMVDKGFSIKEIAEANPMQYIKYYKGILNYKEVTKMTNRNPNVAPIIFWRWGKSGAGKTRFVTDKFGHENVYVKDSSMWWDNYDQQQCILLDDYEPMAFRYFLRLLDRNHMQVQVKGGFVKINSPYIYLTSEFPPEHYYEKENELLQVVRRIYESGGSIDSIILEEAKITEGMKIALAYTAAAMKKKQEVILAQESHWI